MSICIVSKCECVRVSFFLIAYLAHNNDDDHDDNDDDNDDDIDWLCGHGLRLRDLHRAGRSDIRARPTHRLRLHQRLHSFGGHYCRSHPRGLTFSCRHRVGLFHQENVWGEMLHTYLGRLRDHGQYDQHML